MTTAAPRQATKMNDAIVEMAAVANRVMSGWASPAKEIALAMGGFESGYGVPLTDWSNGQFVLSGSTPTYNWGATNASSGMASTRGSDTADGKPITAHWALFPTPHQGLGYFLNGFWSRYPGIREAAENGDIDTVASILYQHGYYGGVPTPGTELHSDEDNQGRISAYAAAIRGWVSRVRQALKAKNATFDTLSPLDESIYLNPLASSVVQGKFPWLAGAILVVGLGFLVLKKK